VGEVLEILPVFVFSALLFKMLSELAKKCRGNLLSKLANTFNLLLIGIAWHVHYYEQLL
jgi:hypothetical protein